jgi:hypothetical protein
LSATRKRVDDAARDFVVHGRARSPRVDAPTSRKRWAVVLRRVDASARRLRAAMGHDAIELPFLRDDATRTSTVVVLAGAPLTREVPMT